MWENKLGLLRLSRKEGCYDKQTDVFSANDPGRNPLSSFDTVGLVMIIFSISRLKNLSNAICTANNVLPLPALPNTKLKGF